MNAAGPEKTRISIRLPAIFAAFLDANVEPALNPHYQTVRCAREYHIDEFCGFDERTFAAIQRCNFTYFMAIIAPAACFQKFETLADWGNWVFPFDGMFDNGVLKDNTEEAAKVTQSLIAGMEVSVAAIQFDIDQDHRPRSNPPVAPRLAANSTSAICVTDVSIQIQADHSHIKGAKSDDRAKNLPFAVKMAKFGPGHEVKLPIVAFHDTVWKRMAQASSVGTQKRFVKAMAEYCSGAMKHVNDNALDRSIGPEEMLTTRIKSAGVSPLFGSVEYAHGLRIPDEVFEHPTIREIELLGVEFVVIHNDMLSYRKEELEGVTHNIIASFRLQGKSAQEAFDAAGKMLQSRHDRWETATRSLPCWGKESDSHVRLYTEGVQNVITANVWWSFASGWYLGKNREAVKRSGELDVMEFPDYLENQPR